MGGRYPTSASELTDEEQAVPNLGGTEVIIILVVVIILFGAKKLPELGSSVGKSITNFKRGLREAQDDDADPEPSANGSQPSARSKTDAG